MTRGRKPSIETQVARAAVAAYQAAQGGPQVAPMGTAKQRIQSRYTAAGQGPRLAAWNPGSGGPNAALSGLQTIRNRHRDNTRNDWTGTSATQKWSTNLIGIGITPRFKRIASKTRRQQIIDLHNEFVEHSDADGVLNLYGQQTLAVRSWLDGGEVFARKRSRYIDEGLVVPMQVQLLEAEMCPLFDATSYQGLPTGNVIRQGIEFNKRGRRVAYWFYKEHPGDPGTAMPQAEKLVRVAASEVTHMFEPLRPGQIRGVSLLAPVLTRIRTISDYDDAVLTRQQLANLFVAFISRKLPPLTGDEDLNGLTGQEEALDGEGRQLVGLQPGIVQTLDDNEEVNWSNPPEAGTTYSDYIRTQHLGTSAAAGLPYELFSGDIKDISDRTLRVVINEFRRLAEQRQWQIIIPMFCQRVMTWFAEAALLAGEISLDEFDDVRRVEWAPHGWAHIHPVQDPQGKKLEVDAGFRSRSSVIGERGDDPDTVDDERAEDKAREDKLGLTPVVPEPAGNAGGPDEQQQQDRQEQRQANNSLLQAFARMEAGLAARSTEQSQPVINVTNNIPATTVQATMQTPEVRVEVAPPNVQVSAPNVTVQNSVEPTPVNVAVSAPNVEVHNEVQPAEVKVSLPKRQTDTTVTRDGQGNIIKTHQVEQDLE
jgi:lambda family phage portal protein